MRGLLILIGLVAFLFAAFATLFAVARGSDIQIIIGLIAATCGTSALTGAGIIGAIERLHPTPAGEQISEITHGA